MVAVVELVIKNSPPAGLLHAEVPVIWNPPMRCVTLGSPMIVSVSVPFSQTEAVML
jgi:hypothetical protein